jgi:hypothetical protein
MAAKRQARPWPFDAPVGTKKYRNFKNHSLRRTFRAVHEITPI